MLGLLVAAWTVGMGLAPGCWSSEQVSVALPAASVRRQLEAISKQTGLRLEASPATSEDVLVLRVRDVEPRELMDQIAWAVSGKWTLTKDGFRLVRTARMEREQREEHFRQRERQIRAAQAELRERIDALPSFSDDEAKVLGVVLSDWAEGLRARGEDAWRGVRSVLSRLPGSRLAQEIAMELDPKALAACDEPGVYTFALAPTAMERPLPQAAANALKRYNANLARLSPQIRLPADSAWEAYGGWPADHLAARPASEMVVRVSLSQMDPGLDVEVILSGGDGRVVGAFSTFLTGGRGDGSPPPAAQKQDDLPLVLSQQSRELLQSLRRAMDGRPTEASPSLMAVIAHPESRELDELAQSDLLFGTAERSGLNLVASPGPNLWFDLALHAMSGEPTQATVLAFLDSPSAAMGAKREGGWLLVRPSDPFLARQSRLDRKVHGSVVRSAAVRNSTTLEEAGDLVLAAPRLVDRTGLYYRLRTILAAPTAESPFRSSRVELLRFHGALTAGERTALASGGALPIGRLNPRSKEELERLVFRSGLLLGDKRGPGRAASLAEIPTKRLPNGLPPGGTVRMEDSRHLVVRCRREVEGTSFFETVDIPALARRLFDHERNPPGDGSQSPWKGLAPATSRIVTYRLDFGGGAIASFMMRNVEEIGADVARPEDLPKAIWDEVAAELARLRRTEPPAFDDRSREKAEGSGGDV